jgi:hypothetical protein
VVKRGAPLRRLTPLKRTQWIRKPTRQQKGWARAVKEVRERSGDRCEVRTPLCIGTGQQTHHRLKRSQGGKADPALLLRICNHCDVFIEANPAISYEHGWLIKSWDQGGPDARGFT